MNVRNWLTIALSSTLVTLVILMGCDTGGGGIVNPPPDNKSYGPPMYKIAFIDTDGSIGTVTEGTSTPHYYQNSGNGKEMGAVDFTALWYTGNNVGDQYHILASTKSTDGVSSANVITETGIVTLVEEDIFPGMVTYSGSGASRVGFIREGANSYELVRKAIDLDEEVIFGTVDKVQYSIHPNRLSMAGSDKMIVSLDHNNGVNHELAIYDRVTGVTRYPIHAASPQFSPDGSRIAYIDAGGNEETDHVLVITDSELQNEYLYDFSQYAFGATALTWHKNSNFVAFYAGVFSNDPILIMVDVLTHEIRHIPVTDRIVVDDDHLMWACPDFSPVNDPPTVVLLVDDGQHHKIITVTFNGTIITIKGNLAQTIVCRPTWKQY